MITLASPFRRATSSDASAMVDLVDMAGDGLPQYLWAQLARTGQSARDVGLDRAKRGSGSFAYGNTVVREIDDRVAACLIGYGLDDSPEPPDEDTPALVRPLVELETHAPNTWYVNVLATYPEYRGRGIGGELLALAESIAQDNGSAGLSLIVADANHGARRLYERNGYAERASRPMVKEDWSGSGKNWVLLVRDF